jgi:glycosyltransferase involved in cell wall biosynthesis
MNCSLIICTYNWPEALSLVLESVVSQSIVPNEIIIADDGSGDTTKSLIDNFSKKTFIPVIHSWQEDDGCKIAHSRNRAIAKSNYEYIIMIDGDTVLHREFIKDHINIAKKGFYTQGSRVLLQPKFTKNVFKLKDFSKPSFFFNHAKNKFNMLHLPLLRILISKFKDKDIRRVRGCNFSIFKEEIIKVNGFNEEITSWGREDSEFVQRLFNSGIYKQHLKFSGIQYHLFHNERVPNSHKSAEENNFFLEDAAQKNLKWCSLGIDRYFKN